MQNNLPKIIIEFDKCSLDTKIFCVIVILALIFIVFYILHNSFKILQKILSYDSFFTLLNKLFLLLKKEITTLPGIINLLLSIVMLLLTIGIFVPSLFFSFKFNENIPASKILFIIITIVTILVSLIAIKNSEREEKILQKNGSA